MKPIEKIQTRKEEADKKRQAKFINEQISAFHKAIYRYEQSGDELSRKSSVQKKKYWEDKLAELQAVDEVVVEDQNELIEDAVDAKSFIEGLEDGVVSAFMSEDAYYKWDEDMKNPIEYSNEQIEENINALALAIRALPEEEYLEAMQSIHRGIER